MKYGYIQLTGELLLELLHLRGGQVRKIQWDEESGPIRIWLEHPEFAEAAG